MGIHADIWVERNLDELTEDQEPDEFVEPSMKGDIGEELKSFFM